MPSYFLLQLRYFAAVSYFPSLLILTNADRDQIRNIKNVADCTVSERQCSTSCS